MIIFCLVPTPSVTVTALNNQQVGDPLLLECNVTTVRGITSSADIVWITNGEEVRRANNASGKTVGNSVVYSNVYNPTGISLYVYHCNIKINTIPLVEANNSFIMGKEIIIHLVHYSEPSQSGLSLNLIRPPGHFQK